MLFSSMLIPLHLDYLTQTKMLNRNELPISMHIEMCTRQENKRKRQIVQRISWSRDYVELIDINPDAEREFGARA